MLSLPSSPFRNLCHLLAGLEGISVLCASPQVEDIGSGRLLLAVNCAIIDVFLGLLFKVNINSDLLVLSVQEEDKPIRANCKIFLIRWRYRQEQVPDAINVYFTHLRDAIEQEYLLGKKAA